jgi:hypothetical protein
MLRFVKKNFVGGSVYVSEILPVPPAILKQMSTVWKLRRFIAELFGSPKIEFYERRLRFTPKDLGKEFAFYDEQKILDKYPSWFVAIDNGNCF